MDVSRAVRKTEAGVELQVFCKPGAGRDVLAGLHAGALKIKVSARPVDGRANAALIEFLSNLLGVPKSSVRVASGDKSRLKRIRVDGIDVSQASDRLSEVLQEDRQ